MTLAVRYILSRGPVIPVVTIDDATDGPDLARALLEGGISVIEVTMRTPAALAAVRAIRDTVPEMLAGVGTLLDPGRIGDVLASGAQFAVSPGLDLALVEACREAGLPLLPGIQTVSEAMAARRAGLDTLKFFPAKAAGGPGALGQIHPVLPELKFCPTGGIGAADAKSYLALANVLCVGGSFPAPTDAIRARDWKTVRENSKTVCSLTGQGFRQG
ncbi:MAG: bifunctional 4-hydroxy-2-oxoglutarate aldolase/2-dehydro-3-deoxy-phosphogluconate aldolase [Thalassobaculaceae bacterium]|nr:bifunctional 4-hydroxy-2-oxoglutarate aldolase/2-dehydro-3-deoxy-phosphogluconate aldolase [Thalassobaculaceae bacterium]